MSGFCWDHHRGYFSVKFYVDLCTRHCFSSLRVEGADNIPQNCAVLLAPNHCCTLMDALLILKAYKGATAYGARADIFRKKTMARILRWLRIVPLARERDGIQAISGNRAIFEEVVDCIGNGVPFCMFCEGTHHPGRLVHPLKGGILRICELASEKLPTGTNICIVPVGLDYDSFYDFQKGVTIRFGKPLNYNNIKAKDHREALSDLQCRIQSLIRCNDPVEKRMPLFLTLPLAILSLPVFAICAICASPILLITLLAKRRIKDMAWINTIRFAASFIFFLHWPFHSGFHYLLNFYKSLFSKPKFK